MTLLRQAGLTLFQQLKFPPLYSFALFAGAGFLAFAFYSIWETTTFIQTAIAVPGRVVGLEQDRTGGSHSGRDDGGYITVFTFSDASGATHTGRTSLAQKPATHDVGEAVIVLYQPESPKTARIRSFQTLWLEPTIFGVTGLICTGIGASAFVTARKTRRTTHHEIAA